MAGEEDDKIAAEESRRKKRNSKGTQKDREREDKGCDETMGPPPRFSLVGRPFTTMNF
jgi:hypothetical protein